MLPIIKHVATPSLSIERKEKEQYTTYAAPISALYYALVHHGQFEMPTYDGNT